MIQENGNPRFLRRMAIAAKDIATTTFWAASGGTSGAFGQWEGHERDRFRDRPGMRNARQDTDLDFGLREDLLSEARSLCQTYAICRRIIRQYAQYVVGSCHVNWDTGNPEWDDQAEMAWRDWMPSADELGVHSFQMMMRLGQISELRDGDVFFRKVIQDGMLRLSYIEADRVKNGIFINVDIEDKIIGGVGLGSINEPVFYRTYQRTKYGQFKNETDYAKAEVLHWFDSDRLEAYRGVTAFASVLNDLRDNKEIKDAEKASHKLRSKIALIVRNAIGRPHGHGVNVLGAGRKGETSVAVETVGDAAIKYQYNGDEFQAFNSNMPADSWFKFSQHLVRGIAIGMDLPFEFVWDMAGLTGPAVRMTSGAGGTDLPAQAGFVRDPGYEPSSGNLGEFGNG